MNKPKQTTPTYSPPVQSKDGRVVWLDFFRAMEMAQMGQPKGKRK